jgi:hypothetical protein
MDSWTRNAVVIAATLTILWNVPLAATESETSDVRIRILDYARIANDVLAQAQQRVTDIYIGIGVQIRWQVTALPLDPSSSGADTVTEPSEFVLIVLSPNMSRRLKIARDAVGMAIVPPQGGGRIAYVLFDRVTLAARAARSDVPDVWGRVMAHEIGHLMLPDGSHSGSGLMRADWKIKELHRPLHSAFEFTNSQGEAIRRRFRRLAPASSANDTR